MYVSFPPTLCNTLSGFTNVDFRDVDSVVEYTQVLYTRKV